MARPKLKDSTKPSWTIDRSVKLAIEVEAARVRSEFDSVGDSWLALPASERSRLIEAWENAKLNGVDLLSAANEKQPQSITSKGIGVVVGDLCAAKLAAGRSKEYVNQLRIVLCQFARGRESLPVDRVSLADVESFLNSRSLAYRSTLRSRISTLFKFAMRRGCRSDNPCARLEPVTYHKPSPQIFTPEQLKTCLDWLRKNPRGLTWFVLTTLCGLRPDEARKTERENIHCLSGHIIVDAQTTKVRERRVVTPMPEAMKWLRRSLKYGGETPLPKQFKRRLIHSLRDVLGLKTWPKDITRHTAASIWLAEKQSAAFVAEQLGNSERVLKRDYKALVTPQTLAQFLEAIRATNRVSTSPQSILPSPCRLASRDTNSLRDPACMG
jgi:integrase